MIFQLSVLLLFMLRIEDGVSQNAYTCLDNHACTRQTLTCDEESECSFVCKGTMACAWSHLTCKDNYDCFVICTGEVDSEGTDFLTCFNTTIQWCVQLINNVIFQFCCCPCRFGYYTVITVQRVSFGCKYVNTVYEIVLRMLSVLLHLTFNKQCNLVLSNVHMAVIVK